MASTVTDRSRAGAALPMKAPCRVATTANISLRGLESIDGVTLAVSDRVLVKDQTTASENAIYLARQGAWERAPDFDGDGDVVQGTLVYVNNGTSGADLLYKVTTADPILIGTTAIAFGVVATVEVVDQATDFSPGTIEIATDAEALVKAATDRALVPSNLAALGATDTLAGLVEKATQTEVEEATAGKYVDAALLWAAPFRGGWKNIFGANGGAEVWLRGAGGSASISVAASTTAYTLDRVYLTTGANQASTVSQQAGFTDGSRFCARVQRNSGQTGTGQMVMGFPLDTDEVISLRNKKSSLRISLRAGANWSPTSGALTISLYVGTGSAAKRGGGFTGETQVYTTTANLSTNGTIVVATALSSAVVPSNVTQADLVFAWTPTGTAGAADYFEWDDLDGRRGDPVIDQFERRPFDDELRACMRHFWKSFAYGTAPATAAGSSTGEIGWYTTATGAAVTALQLLLPVPMRVSPTAIIYNPNAANNQVRNQVDAADCTGSGISAASDATKFRLLCTTNAGAAVNELLAAHVTLDAGI